MGFCGHQKLFSFLILFLAFFTAGFSEDQREFVELSFKYPGPMDSDGNRSLESLVRVQGTGQFCQDGLYLIAHFGDREALFRRENQRAIDEPMINQTWRFCSVFSAVSDKGVIMGRNWDNQNVGSIIVSFYHPPGRYASVSFTRSIDLGFGHKDLIKFKSTPFSRQLLMAPFYAYDGVNEQGLSVAVAGVRQVKIVPKPGQKPIFISYLVRRILDGCRTIREAMTMAEKYAPFDLDVRSLNTHLMVADATGHSVILEYDDNEWRSIKTNNEWQVLTNKPMHGVSEAQLREKCWRFRNLSQTLEGPNFSPDWKAGMSMLEDVAQKGTTWSTVYLLTTGELYFSVYQTWNRIFHLDPFTDLSGTKKIEEK